MNSPLKKRSFAAEQLEQQKKGKNQVLKVILPVAVLIIVVAGYALEQLAVFLTPLGDLTKDEVRDHARALGLRAVAEKPDSAEICFTAGGDYRDFLRARLGSDDDSLRPGDFVTREGERVPRDSGNLVLVVHLRIETASGPVAQCLDAAWLTEIDAAAELANDDQIDATGYLRPERAPGD